MPTPSQKLSQLKGSPVEINLQPGEDLAAAEDRILREHPQDFQSAVPNNQDLVPEALGAPSAAMQLPDNIQQIQAYAQRLPFGSKEQEKAYKIFESERDNYIKLHPAPKSSDVKTIPPNIQDDINTLRDAIANNPKLLMKKSSGFGGKGIDTGPIVGGSATLPSWLGGATLRSNPSAMNEFVNRQLGEGENSADRTELRQLEKQLFNPKKKEISGAAVSDLERFVDLMPLIPEEGENDLGFFKKGLQLQQASHQKLRDILDTAERSGFDTSKFQDLKKTPEQVLDELFSQLTQGLSLDPQGNIAGNYGEYSFPSVMPDTAKAFLKKNAAPAGKATKRYNPQTGQFEDIQ